MSHLVRHYGLHQDEGVYYLHQGRKQATNFISLNRQSPFEVLSPTGRKIACPHLLNASVPMPDKVHWALLMKILADPLVKYFLPIPREAAEPIPFIEDLDNQLMMPLVLLSRLSSPIYPVVHQYRNLTRLRILAELQVTNIAPFVITGLRTEAQMDIESLIVEARRMPRRLILSGDPMMIIRPPMVRIQTAIQDFDEVELHSAPMESLGAVTLRRFARGEKIDSPWVRKE